MTRWAAVTALCLILVLAAGALLIGGEVWWAARGARAGDPPAEPDDLPTGPGGPGGIPVPVVAWLGDSTAAGVGASERAGTVAEQVAGQLGGPIRLMVLARSGARVADVLRIQLPQVARLQPTEVFVSVGANDATHLTPRSRFRRDYGRLLTGLPTSVARIVLLGVPDMGAPPRLAQPLRSVAGWRGRELAGDIRQLAQRRHDIYVDIAGATGPTFRRQPGRYFAPDRYHPNDTGYGLWAPVVVAAVRNGPQFQRHGGRLAGDRATER